MVIFLEKMVLGITIKWHQKDNKMNRKSNQSATLSTFTRNKHKHLEKQKQ